MTRSQLVAELDSSRRAIARDFSALRTELDFVEKSKRSVREHSFAWLGGAAVLGYVLSGRRKKKAQKLGVTKPDPQQKTPLARFEWGAFLLATFRIALPLLRPIFSAYAAKRLAALLGETR